MDKQELEDKVKHGFSGFFRDSRGQFSIFTVVALFGASALIYIGLIEVVNTHRVQVEIIYALFIMYCVNAMSETLVGAVIARGMWRTPPAPDTLIEADVNVGGPAEDESKKIPG